MYTDQTLLLLIKQLLLEEKYDEALKECHVYLKDKSKEEVWEFMIDSLEFINDSQKVIDLLRRALQDFPLNLKFNFSLGKLLAQEGKSEEALKFLTLARLFSLSTAEIDWEIAQIYLKLGRHEEATKSWFCALNNKPIWSTLNHYIEGGKLLIEQKMYKEALHLYHLGLELDPNNSQINHNIGEIHRICKNWHGAIRYYRKVLENESQNIVTHFRLGDVLLCLLSQSQNLINIEHKRYLVEEALNSLDSAIKYIDKLPSIDQKVIQNRIAYAYLLLGDIFLEKGLNDQAIVAFKQSLTENDQNTIAYLKIGDAYAQQSLWNEAISYYQKHIFLQSKNVLGRMGYAQAMTKNWDDAIKTLSHAITFDRTNVKIAISYIECLEISGNLELAILESKNILEIYPEDHELISKLNSLTVKQTEKNNSQSKFLIYQNELQTKKELYSTAFLMQRYFDAVWYLNTYSDVQDFLRNNPSRDEFFHYLHIGSANGYSPNSEFDESWYISYYKDVKVNVNSGELLCGFEHYILAGRYENRLPSHNLKDVLESKYPGITRPVGIEQLVVLENKLSSLNIRIDHTENKVNFLLPTLDVDIMFGGYIAAMNFIQRMVEQSIPLRLIICNEEPIGLDLLFARLRDKPNLKSALKRCEIINLTELQKISISFEDKFIAYDSWTATIASQIANLTNCHRFCFFIQEYESIFHYNCSVKAIVDNSYKLPHIAIFNSKVLANFFRDKNIGVFSGLMKSDFLVFEHALANISPPSIDHLITKGKRSLLFYGRPEQHAARNLFELGVLGLKEAIARDVFDSSWEFHGIGTLGKAYDIQLGKGKYLHLKSKLPLHEYEQCLQGFDIGLSLMYAPHPSLLPFEMIKAGMIVITNTYENRNKEWFDKISKNIICCDTDIKQIASALELAASRSRDFDSRIKYSKLPFPVNWDCVFDESFIRRLFEIW